MFRSRVKRKEKQNHAVNERLKAAILNTRKSVPLNSVGLTWERQLENAWGRKREAQTAERRNRLSIFCGVWLMRDFRLLRCSGPRPGMLPITNGTPLSD